MHMKISSVKWWPFCSGGDGLIVQGCGIIRELVKRIPQSYNKISPWSHLCVGHITDVMTPRCSHTCIWNLLPKDSHLRLKRSIQNCISWKFVRRCWKQIRNSLLWISFIFDHICCVAIVYICNYWLWNMQYIHEIRSNACINWYLSHKQRSAVW